jgi:valyl-tRNA synthetase
VDLDDPSRCGGCGGADIRQDPDVLDTWFSSALWPFSTLGWPERTEDLAAYYPTSVLITGYDIIFFWVARMIMMGLKFMDEVPFRTVFFTGLVRDAQGRKMSKTTGNAIDLLEAVDRWGVDPVRFTFCALSVPGADIPLAEERVGGYSAFCNKMWNAVRFAKRHLPEGDGPAPLPHRESLSLADRWILSALDSAVEDVNRSFGEFRFDEAANRLYHFAWHEYCDWYLEMAKTHLNGDRPEAARAVLGFTLDTLLRLLHPIIPFVTEELRAQIPHEGGCAAAAVYPMSDRALRDPQAERDVAFLIECGTAFRNARAEASVPPSARVPGAVFTTDPALAATVGRIRGYLATLTRIDPLEIAARKPGGTAPAAIVSGAELYISPPVRASAAADRSRLEGELSALLREVEPWEQKLGNAQFLERAKPEVVEKARRVHREIAEKIARIRESLSAPSP